MREVGITCENWPKVGMAFDLRAHSAPFHDRGGLAVKYQPHFGLYLSLSGKPSSENDLCQCESMLKKPSRCECNALMINK